MSEKLTLDRLASTFFISKSSLTKYLEENIGFTFSELLNRIRFSKAIDLLMFSEKSLNEIAKRVGYTDSSHFTKIFENTEGINPGEFRNYYNIKQVSLKQSEAKLLDSVINYEIKTILTDLTIGKVAKNLAFQHLINRLIYFQFEKISTNI
ncbi:MAG: helix-turn-helix transcriptional regulator [Anaerococcus obesiensis]